MFTTPVKAKSNIHPLPAPGHARRSIRRTALVFVAATSLLMAACGSDDANSIAADDSSTNEAAVSAPVSTGPTEVGDVLVDDAGLSLYGFLPDEGGTPTCGGACADAWPPVTLASGDLPEGLDPSIFGVVEGIDGGFQLTAGNWPLYRFAGDAAAGDITGQGSGDAWFLVAPDGSLIS